MYCTFELLSPCISENASLNRIRQVQRRRGVFGGILDDIQTDLRQHVKYLYFTLDMYSNREVNEKHSRNIGKSLWMTNG